MNGKKVRKYWYNRDWEMIPRLVFISWSIVATFLWSSGLFQIHVILEINDQVLYYFPHIYSFKTRSNWSKSGSHRISLVLIWTHLAKTIPTGISVGAIWFKNYILIFHLYLPVLSLSNQVSPVKWIPPLLKE